MTYVMLRSNFADCGEYRMLAMNVDWVQRLKDRMKTHTTADVVPLTHDGGETLFIMKGESQLLLCDNDYTYHVRRVEYSNSLLLSEELPMCNHDDEILAHTLGLTGKEMSGKTQRRKHVVVSSSERLFETKRACPQQDAVKLLKEHPITVEEIEADEGKGICHDTIGGVGPSDGRSNQHYTFPQLVSLSRCSARELSETLTEEGAIVHNGYVRVLNPSLLREALRAVVFFLEGCEEVSWDAVTAHLCPSVYPLIVVRVVRAVYGIREAVECATGAAALLRMKKVLQTLAAAAVEELSIHSDDNQQNGTSEKSTYFPTVDFERFYDVWVNSIPASFFASGEIPQRSEKTALLSLLHGVIIIRGVRNENYTGASVVFAPRDELATDISKRMTQLFELNPERWGADALRAYLEPLLDPGVVFDQFVLRYAKEFRAPKQPVTYGKLA